MTSQYGGRHPRCLINRYSAHFGENCEFEFGIYKYIPQTVSDERLIIKVSSSEVDNWFAEQSKKLHPNYDIAIQSRVYDKHSQETYHIPMIDFAGGLTKADFIRVEQSLSDIGLTDFYVVKSGRSFHLYGYPLIPSSLLSSFFGRVLLLNEPNKSPISDVRWIGHRLIAGYGALRWTCNNSHYKGIPEIIDLSELN